MFMYTCKGSNDCKGKHVGTMHQQMNIYVRTIASYVHAPTVTCLFKPPPYHLFPAHDKFPHPPNPPQVGLVASSGNPSYIEGGGGGEEEMTACLKWVRELASLRGLWSVIITRRAGDGPPEWEHRLCEE